MDVWRLVDEMKCMIVAVEGRLSKSLHVYKTKRHARVTNNDPTQTHPPNPPTHSSFPPSAPY